MALYVIPKLVMHALWNNIGNTKENEMLTEHHAAWHNLSQHLKSHMSRSQEKYVGQQWLRLQLLIKCCSYCSLIILVLKLIPSPMFPLVFWGIRAFLHPPEECAGSTKAHKTFGKVGWGWGGQNPEGAKLGREGRRMGRGRSWSGYDKTQQIISFLVAAFLHPFSPWTCTINMTRRVLILSCLLRFLSKGRCRIQIQPQTMVCSQKKLFVLMESEHVCYGFALMYD